jgi:hypothetical protein
MLAYNENVQASFLQRYLQTFSRIEGSIVLTVVLLAPRLASTAEQFYDLGGPCKDEVSISLRELDSAKKSGSWDRVVELAKADVRGGCGIEYRWEQLVDGLVQAKRQTEALQVLQEVNSRDFDLEPGIIGREFPRVEQFMNGPLFKSSPLGLKMDQFKKASDARRLKFNRLLEALPSSQRPPRNYIAKHACPFECCRYGKWTVAKDTDLVAAPDSTQVVGKARKGSSALGLTGEVHLVPEPVVVLGGELPKNSIAFILDYEGEGFGHVYTHGMVVSTFLGYEKYCFRISDYCWGETLLPSKQPQKPVWWVKVRLPNGVTGWTDKPDNFDGKDGCG